MSSKISIIGAGSAAFSLALINDVVRTPGLADSTVSFMDINEERLDTVYVLCRRYAEESGVRLNLEKTTYRQQSIADAHFVIHTALAAPHGRLREGWEIARKVGYRFGGSLHIIHDEAFWVNFYQLRLMEDIAKEVLSLSPKAWYILVANPVQAGTTYLQRKYPELRLVGMCHGTNGVYGLAQKLGMERQHVTFECPGVNHFVWLTKLFYKGQDAMPALDRWVAEESIEFHKTCGMSCHEGPKPVDLYKRFGAFPIGDTATPGGGSWGWWYHTSDDIERFWKEDPWTWFQNYFDGGLENVRRMSIRARDMSSPVTDMFPNAPTNEPIISVIEGLATSKERTVIVNVLNDGNYVPGVPLNYQVEVPAVVSSRGVHPLRTDGLPTPILAHLLADRVAPVETELAAFEKGSRALLLDLILMDPWTRSLEQAESLLEGILSLPYHQEMRQHYR